MENFDKTEGDTFEGLEEDMEEARKVLEDFYKTEANVKEGANFGGLENTGDLEKQWSQRRSGGQGEEKETEEKEEKEEEVSVSEDELIASLKEVEEEEEEEELDLVIKRVMEEMGNASAKEILELGREVLSHVPRSKGRGL